MRDRLGSALFRLGSSHANVRFRLVGTKTCTNILAYFDVGNVDGDNRERSLVVQAAFENSASDQVRVLKNTQMAFRGSDGADDTLSNTRNDRLFRGAADQLKQIGSYGDSSLHLELDTIPRDCGQETGATMAWIRTIDNARMHRSLHGI